MMGTSNFLQTHTESSRQMRGAWKAEHEYIPELCTEQHKSLVGCNGDGTRYSTRVSSKERTF